MCNEPNYYSGRLSVSYYDSTGQFQGVQSYGEPGIKFMPHYDGASPIPDGGFIAAVEQLDSTGGNIKAMIWRFNAEGDTVWTKMLYVDTTITSIASKAVQARNNRFALVGSRYDGLNSKVFLALYDAFSDLQWTNEYGGSGVWNRYAISLDTLADGGFVIGAYRALFGSDPDIDSWVIRTDSSGIVLWEQYFNTSHGEGGPRAMAWGSDRIIVAQREWGEIVVDGTTYGRVLPKVSMLDTSGLLIWERTFPGLWRSAWDWPTAIKCFSDTSFLISSRAWHQITDDDSGCLLNLSESGDSLWYREYWTADSTCGLSSLYPTSFLVEPTGNIVLVGQWGYCGEDHWVMRVDNDGMPPPTMQLWTNIEESSARSAVLLAWPNPTTGVVYLDPQDPSFIMKTFDLLDITGRTLLRVEAIMSDPLSLDLSSYPAGIYLARLMDPRGRRLTSRILKQ